MKDQIAKFEKEKCQFLESPEPYQMSVVLNSNLKSRSATYLKKDDGLPEAVGKQLAEQVSQKIQEERARF